MSNSDDPSCMPYTNIEDRRACSRRHYERNKAAYKERAAAFTKQQRQLLSQWVINYKADKPCADCNTSYHPQVMEFDHINSDKEDNVSNLVGRGVSLSRLQQEIAKCELVCANCHRLRTFHRRHREPC